MAKLLQQYGLGLAGVNRVKNPIELKEGELTVAQNAALSAKRGRAAIGKRLGFGRLLTVEGASVLAIMPVPFDDPTPGTPLADYPPYEPPPPPPPPPAIGPTSVVMTNPDTGTLQWATFSGGAVTFVEPIVPLQGLVVAHGADAVYYPVDGGIHKATPTSDDLAGTFPGTVIAAGATDTDTYWLVTNSETVGLLGTLTVFRLYRVPMTGVDEVLVCSPLYDALYDGVALEPGYADLWCLDLSVSALGVFLIGNRNHGYQRPGGSAVILQAVNELDDWEEVGLIAGSPDTGPPGYPEFTSCQFENLPGTQLVTSVVSADTLFVTAHRFTTGGGIGVWSVGLAKLTAIGGFVCALVPYPLYFDSWLGPSLWLVWAKDNEVLAAKWVWESGVYPAPPVFHASWTYSNDDGDSWTDIASSVYPDVLICVGGPGFSWLGTYSVFNPRVFWDGSNTIYLVDPANFSEVWRLYAGVFTLVT